SRSALADAVAETLKYAVKPSDMTKDREWFHELTRQVFKLRFVSTGGVLKDLFKEETSEEDLLLLTEEEETDKELGSLYFNWYKTKAKYRRKITE
ncbi:protein rep, partial [Citrobacter sp. SL156]